MGNSASNPANGRQLHPQRRTQSPSPSPGAPHRSLRTKKKSLELPDLASLSLASGNNPPQRQSKTQSIPIPTSSGVDPQRERGRVIPDPFSSTDLLDSQPHNNGATRGTPYYRTQQQQQVQQRRIQELYNQSNVPASPPEVERPPGSPAFRHELVRSSIPLALQPKPRVLGGDGTQSSLLLPDGTKPQPVPVKIVWRGGGHNVLLARAGDDEWKGRRVMERENAGSPIFETTVHLLPGTHHIRFLVDDQWRVADDLPTAVDDQGSLANYVAVPIGGTASTSMKAKDPSFFSEGSSTAIAAAAAAAAANSPPPPRTGPNPAQQAQWTNVLPPELLEAFKEEELYLNANQGQPDPQTHHHRVSGFVPAPNIPPAPALPRHLDKLILNNKITPGPAQSAVGNVGPVGNAASVVQSSAQSGGVGSGQGRSGRRDRTREERREERRRGRERGYSDASGTPRRMPPPAPPPSEVGEISASLADSAASITPTATRNVRPSTSGGTIDTITESGATSETASGANSTAATTPATPSTPIPGASTPAATFTPVLSASAPSTSAAPLVASRTLTIDTTTMPPLTDDASVLAVPSHVVLHHLCTSAIRNGVLAVATTTRYKKKYLTTVYYKPT